jgi:hypothetical protein
MASSSQNTRTDVHPELSRLLGSCNVAQGRLTKAIRHDAREAKLRAHLHSTLRNITDGANEEQGEERENGQASLGPESPEMLARCRVYEKALGEARRNPRIEKFLVMELEKDADLTDYLSLNLPKEGDREFLYRVLTIAVELGYVELVKRLSKLEQFDVNRGRYYAFRDRLTPLNLAAKLGNVEMVNIFLACNRSDRNLSPEGYWALHWAANMGHAEVVNAILLNKDVNVTVLMSINR